MKTNCFSLIICIVFINFILTDSLLYAQQIPDTSFTFSIYQSAYKSGKGPEILIDEAHNNFHTMSGGFSPFAKLLRQDGYKIEGLKTKIHDAATLTDCEILVIVNPLNPVNDDNWSLPTPSAFTKDEILIIKRWVENGGRLLLIADHMPFAGASNDLAKAFGFEFLNGFAYTRQNMWPPSVFKLKDYTLQKSVITKGIKNYEMIDSVATFTGSAIKAPKGAIHILSFTENNYCLMPDTAWQFNNNTPKKYLGGYDQGAILTFGKGKVAVFGEAAMFTAQLVSGRDLKIGFSSPLAPQNAQFALNLIHWLDGIKNYNGRVNDTNYK